MQARLGGEHGGREGGGDAGARGRSLKLPSLPVFDGGDGVYKHWLGKGEVAPVLATPGGEG